MVFDLDPGPGATILDCCRVGARPPRPARRARARVGREDVGLEGPPPRRAAAHGRDRRQTKEFARDGGTAARQARPEAGHRVMKKEQRRRQGVRRLEPERRAQDDRRARTRCAARNAPTVSAPVSWDEVSDALDAERSRRPDVRGRRGARTGRAARRPLRRRTCELEQELPALGRQSTERRWSSTARSRSSPARAAASAPRPRSRSRDAGVAVACAARATDADPLPLPGTIDDTVRRITDAGGERARRARPTSLDDEDVERDGRHDRRALRPARHPREQRRDHVSRRPRRCR